MVRLALGMTDSFRFATIKPSLVLAHPQVLPQADSQHGMFVAGVTDKDAMCFHGDYSHSSLPTDGNALLHQQRSFPDTTATLKTAR
jgi:hypothetical protein